MGTSKITRISLCVFRKICLYTSYGGSKQPTCEQEAEGSVGKPLERKTSCEGPRWRDNRIGRIHAGSSTGCEISTQSNCRVEQAETSAIMGNLPLLRVWRIVDALIGRSNQAHRTTERPGFLPASFPPLLVGASVWIRA